MTWKVLQWDHALALGSTNIVPFLLGLEFDILYLWCTVQLTAGLFQV